MNEIKKYLTVRESNYKDLDDAVNGKIKEGWQPFGSPYVTDATSEFLACQAMVSTKNQEPASAVIEKVNEKIREMRTAVID